MTLLEAETASAVSKKTVVKFEAGGEVRAGIAERLRLAFEAAGVIFANDGHGLSWG